MKKVIPGLFLILFVVFINSCYYDKEQLLYKNTTTTCDTTGTISYATKVQPVLSQYCYSCHSGNTPSGGIAMGTYAADKVIGANGKLYGSISYSSGYFPMPQG
ncbi:MAG: hypothetical protein JSU05_05215, partial [Bacteroidetes bacterium]|nr:hypothetical protein [Bacteroidota bacterium]